MANTQTTIASLTEEVADLLRHDNLDVRIVTWVQMALQDMVSRAPISLWNQITKVSISIGSEITNISPTSIQGPISLIVVNGSSDVYVPRYLTQIDFDRMAHGSDSGAARVLDTGTIPLFWTIGPSDADPGDSTGSTLTALYVYPVPTQAWECYLIFQGVRDVQLLTDVQYLPVPYHFEHVLVWGATSFGAKAIRPNLYPIYRAEYERSLEAMIRLMAYKTDSAPVLRSVTGPYIDSGYANLQLPITE